MFTEQGQQVVKVKGVIKSKTNRGIGKRKWMLMDFTIYREQEVKAIRLLLDVLPPPGCRYCTQDKPVQPVGQDPACCCDLLFLQQKDPLNWCRTDSIWFKQAHVSMSRLKQATKEVSLLAKTDKIYTKAVSELPI